MRVLRSVLATAMACGAVLITGSAVAQSTRVSDPSGDGLMGRRLDITSIRLSNRDHAIVVAVSFVKVAHGDLAVAIRERRQHRDEALIVSHHRADGDASELYTIDGLEVCDGLGVVWDETRNRARVRVPSTCIDNGDYGAVKVQAITEMATDADFAPKGPHGKWRWTGLVSRG